MRRKTRKQLIQERQKQQPQPLRTTLTTADDAATSAAAAATATDAVGTVIMFCMLSVFCYWFLLHILDVFSWPIIIWHGKKVKLYLSYEHFPFKSSPSLVAGDGKVTPGALCSLQPKAWFWLIQGGLLGLRQRHRIGRDILTSQKVVIRCSTMLYAYCDLLWIGQEKHEQWNYKQYVPTTPRRIQPLPPFQVFRS